MRQKGFAKEEKRKGRRTKQKHAPHANQLLPWIIQYRNRCSTAAVRLSPFADNTCTALHKSKLSSQRNTSYMTRERPGIQIKHSSSSYRCNGAKLTCETFYPPRVPCNAQIPGSHFYCIPPLPDASRFPSLLLNTPVSLHAACLALTQSSSNFYSPVLLLEMRSLAYKIHKSFPDFFFTVF